MRIVRWFLILVVLAALGAALAYYLAGKADGPAIVINQPSVIGQTATLDVTIDTPAADLSALSIELEQNGRVMPVLPDLSAAADSLAPDGDGSRIRREIGRRAMPDLRDGSVTIRVAASRPVLRGLRQVHGEGSRTVQVRLTPPRVSVASTHHYVNVGGSELVVYRSAPADASSGVQVGDHAYPGFPGTGAGLTDPDLRVAFFALLYDQAPGTPMAVVARDPAGNESRAEFDHRIFPKSFRNSRIPLDDRFLSRVVPAILHASPGLKANPADLLPSFLTINNELRRQNNQMIAGLAKRTAPSILWDGAFEALGGSQVESAFADFRTYTYDGKDVDRQVHLGFDLAKTANAPVTAANHGTVIFAEYLGIYGNTVVVDHGMGVQSLYAHLASFAVQDGAKVKKGQTLGASGQTGLAGGDHLHFSMLVNGQFVNATEWWDPHWIEDRVLRKLRDAGARVSTTP